MVEARGLPPPRRCGREGGSLSFGAMHSLAPHPVPSSPISRPAIQLDQVRTLHGLGASCRRVKTESEADLGTRGHLARACFPKAPVWLKKTHHGIVYSTFTPLVSIVKFPRVLILPCQYLFSLRPAWGENVEVYPFLTKSPPPCLTEKAEAYPLFNHFPYNIYDAMKSQDGT